MSRRTSLRIARRLPDGDEQQQEPSSGAAIEFAGLEKRWGETVALAGVSFSCRARTVTALIGVLVRTLREVSFHPAPTSTPPAICAVGRARVTLRR